MPSSSDADQPTAFAGSISAKSKAELVSIAEALDIPDYEDMKAIDLKHSVADWLEENREELKDTPMFKGLYGKRRGARATDTDEHADSQTPEPSSASRQALKTAQNGTNEVLKATKGKAKDLLNAMGVDPKDVALPESPMRTVRSAANAVARQAEPVINDAAVQVRATTKELIQQWRKTGRKDVEIALRHGQEYLSNSTTLVTLGIFLELIILLVYIVPHNKLEVQFPPSQWSSNPISRFIYSVFFWVPEYKQSFYLPDSFAMFRSDGSALGGFLWWLFFTIIPPFILSHLISFVPQQSKAPTNRTRGSSNHVSHPIPTMDPLVFAITRFAILLFPLTTAAPDLWINSLEKLGSLQGRALVAGLTAGYVLCERLSSLA